MSILKFEPNTPVRVSLKFPSGKHVKSKLYGSEQVMYSFTDGSVGYVPQVVEQQIEEQGIRPGQEFEITRTQANGKTEWTVSPIRKPQLVARILDEQAEEFPDASSATPSGSQGSTPRKPPTTQLANALKTALAAAKDAEAYSVEIGHPVQFDKDDIRLMAQTLVINASKERAA